MDKTQQFPLYFPVFFVLMWLGITTFLGLLSGWYALMRRYPDQNEEALQTYSRQSGSMNRVSKRSLLTLGMCPSGLRVGMTRLFGPFCRDFFVPWNEIQVTRKHRFLRDVAVLTLGSPATGTLVLDSDLADRMARAAGDRWPEPGPFPVPAPGEVAARLVRQWVATTAVAATFFTLAPRLLGANAAAPPVLMTILFPAIVFGIVIFVPFLFRDRK